MRPTPAVRADPSKVFRLGVLPFRPLVSYKYQSQKHQMSRPFPSLTRLNAAAIVMLAMIGLVVPVLAASKLGDLPAPVAVKINGDLRYVTPGATLAEAIQNFRLRADAADLLDVEGRVLRPGAYPGRVALNGRRAELGTPLSEGDSITVEEGRDRTEPLVRQVSALPGTQPGNPQFFLGEAQGEQVVTRGRISGKLASVVFRPTGRARVPRAVALTFDDGPSPVYTPRILRILRRLHAKATFFAVGYLAERYPELIRRQLQAGMTVANHSFDHPSATAFQDLPPSRIRREMARANSALTAAGAHPRLFRPPGGTWDAEMLEIARRLGLRLVLWNVDGEDWRRGGPKGSIVRHVLGNVGPGSIVVLHDGGGDRSATVAALPDIIKGIRKKHLRLVAMER